MSKGIDNRTEEQRAVQDAILVAMLVAHILNGKKTEQPEPPLDPEIGLFQPMLNDQMKLWLLPDSWRWRIERALTVWHRQWRGYPLAMNVDEKSEEKA